MIGEIANARAEIREAEKRLRLLLAYGREFVEPRPYTLDSLAQAAGMSVSGVRTAYDNEEIFTVAKLIGAKLRRREDPDAPTGPPAAASSSPADTFFEALSQRTGRPAAESAQQSVASKGKEKPRG